MRVRRCILGVAHQGERRLGVRWLLWRPQAWPYRSHSRFLRPNGLLVTWHLADIDADAEYVRFWGRSGHDLETFSAAGPYLRIRRRISCWEDHQCTPRSLERQTELWTAGVSW